MIAIPLPVPTKGVTMSKTTGKLPIESNDDARLRALSGMPFDPNGTIQLPSGHVITGKEAQAFSSLFGDDCSRFPDINRAKLLGQTIQLESTSNPPQPAVKQTQLSPSWSRRIVWQFFR